MNDSASTDVSFPPAELMATLVSLCKRRGFIFQASEIYGGLNGFFDYGPLGAEVRRNIKDAWWKAMVQKREDIVGLDSAIIQHPQVWKSSGHLANFTDPLVDCKESKLRYRADHIYFAPVVVEGQKHGYVSVLEDSEMQSAAEKQAKKMLKQLGVPTQFDTLELKPFTEATEEEVPLVPSPATGKPGSLTPPREFNMMFKTQVGAMSGASGEAYLRPETAQGIFTNFKNVVDSGRVKIPFGIAQIGKAFRNEITVRNYIFRCREFEQMEMEYFIPPGDDVWPLHYKEWIQWCHNWLVSVGIKEEWLGRDVHKADGLAHYSKACTDITFHYPFGEQELWGIAVRSNYDLTQHQEGSGKSMEYFDEASKEKYIPHVIEPAVGVDRIFLAILVSAYTEDNLGKDKRSYLKFDPKIAPYKAAVLPLVKNKPELVGKAREVFERLNARFPCFYDESGAVGRRYRRMDEIGTPFCITVDFDTIEKDSKMTLRFRDSGDQQRLSLDEIEKTIFDALI